MNVTKIANKLADIFFPDKVDKRFIYSFITKCRLAIANYTRIIYQLDCIAPTDSHFHIAVDESLFTHIDGVQHWLIGLLNTGTNDLRIEVATDRREETLKAIIENHIGKGNYIISDAWQGYSFLNAPNSGYEHHIYNHSRGNFGRGIDSTSRIESIWAELKSDLKKIYKTIRSTNFIYFLREIEYRRNLKKLNCNEKLENFATLLSCVGINSDDSYLSEKELMSFNYDTLFDD